MTFVNDDFWRDLIVAGVGALLGFVFSYAMWQIAKRRGARKQLSYDLNRQLALPSAAGSLAEPVSVTYDEAKVSNLYFVTLSIENTGDRAVRDQRVRLDIKGAQLLKWILDPVPDPEYGVDTEGGADGTDLALIIGHLERQQIVTLKVALSATEAPQIRPVPYNPEGDVEFIPRSVKNRDNELIPIGRAIALAAAIIMLPGLVRPLPGGEYISSVLQLALVVAILPYAPKAIRAISLRLSARGVPGVPSVNQGLWVTDGKVVVEHMALGPSSMLTIDRGQDPALLHPGIILLRDAIAQHFAESSGLAQILVQLAEASKEMQSSMPNNFRIRVLLEEVCAAFAGAPQEEYIKGVVAVLLMQFPATD
ncbi:hypothetical protein [Nonomuraea wenchangensis]|uniref:hypothetical protein n=1 Tax=Nonomuraea wenchangensis TaxID=568860 RepID=UPI0037AA7875